MDLAQMLKNLRREKGLTQEELANATGLSFHSINSYESGRRTPNSKAMAILESFFGVSGEYLRGDSPKRLQAAQWDDPEIMAIVRESLPKQVSGLTDILNGCTDQEQKLTFDILVELAHVLKLGSLEQRVAAITLLQSVFAASTRYIDVCVNATQDIEPATRIEKAKEAALAQYNQALDGDLLLPH